MNSKINNKLNDELDKVFTEMNDIRNTITETDAMKYFYEDNFLKIFDKKYITLKLEHQQLEYKYVYDGQIGGDIFDMIQDTELTRIRKQIIKYTKLYNIIGAGSRSIIHQNAKYLFVQFVKYLKEKHQIILDNNPLYLYQLQTYKHLNIKIPYSTIYINKRIITTHKFIHLHIDMLFDDFTKYKKYLIYNILNAINKIEKHGDILIYMPLIFDIDLILLFTHLFTDIYLIYPTYLAITKANVYFLLKNKINNCTLPLNINFKIKMITHNEKYIKKINTYIIIIHKLVKDYFIFVSYLNWIKLNNILMYNIIHNKILEKIIVL